MNWDRIEGNWKQFKGNAIQNSKQTPALIRYTRMEGAVEALELVAEEEQLYLDYLGARLEQARHAVASAATDLNIGGKRCFVEPTADIDTLRSAEAEFAAQAERVEQAKQAVARVRNTELGPSSEQQ